MEVSNTEWLTEEFLKHALQEGNDSSNITIKNYDVKFAIPKGENYTSDILRVNVVYVETITSNEEQELVTSLIIKAPKSGGGYEMMFQMGIIQKEYNIFNNFFPKLRKILSKNEDFVAAKIYPSKLDNFLVMEDLNAVGFTLVDRMKQLDYSHGEIVLKKMAKFHAANTKLVEDEPELIEECGYEPVFHRKNKLDEKLINNIDGILGKSQLITLAKEVETWPESKKYAEKLYRLADNAWELQFKLHEINDEYFNCLIHGDLWSSNMLFKYSKNGLPEDVRFVDYQILHYDNIALDIYYFLFSSLKFEVLENDLNSLLKIYLQHLNDKLEKFGSKKRLSEEKFKKMMNEMEIFGFLTSCRILLFVFAEKDEIVDFSDEKKLSSKEENHLIKYYKSKNYRSKFPKYLDYFSKSEWFQNL